MGRDSSVGIRSDSVRYGLDGPGIESRWGTRLSAPVQTCPGAHQASCTIVPGLSWGQSGRGVVLTTHPHLAPKLRKEQSYISTSPVGLRCLFYGELYLLYVYVYIYVYIFFVM